MLLIFNADESSVQKEPPPHGARGPVHTCFLTPSDRYQEWKAYLEGKGVPITQEIEWRAGLRSFYFEDPAGNVLEIAEGDMWPVPCYSSRGPRLCRITVAREVGPVMPSTPNPR